MKNFYRPNNRFTRKWTKFWIQRGGLTRFGRFAMKMAAVYIAPHKDRVLLARLADTGYIDKSVIIDHDELILGNKVFIDQRCILFKRDGSGAIEIGDRVAIYRDVYMESGWGGSILIDKNASIHPRCQINAYVESIHIGENVMLAPFCALYSYNHGLKPDDPISKQPLTSKGPIVIGDDAWLAVGVIVTSGVTIGAGAAIGAGSVVTKDIPPNAIAAGNPAKVIRFRK
jgi:acetyltransferase-like isoleucine patch superfamily enzyme